MELPTADQLALGLLWLVVFVFSTTCHEAAHALVAYRLGDPTAYHGGQVTLNPGPHLRREPVGMILVPILSFFLAGWMIGWASAPYDPQWALRHPKRSALMALAGPISNLVLAVTAALGIRLGIALGAFQAPASATFASVVAAPGGGMAEALAAALSIAFTLNLLLFVFNLFPVPPLDGSGVLPLVMSDDAARTYQSFLFSQPMLAWVGILVAWRLVGTLFSPLFTLALNALYPGHHYA